MQIQTGDGSVINYTEATERIPQAIENCGLWPTTAVPAAENKPVGSSYPALFISGDWDYVTFPNGLHSVLDNFGDCPTVVSLQFLSSPVAETDMSCTEIMRTEWAPSS